jgi:hypothetical protein
MVFNYSVAVTKDKTTVYMKVPYDCLSYKQKMHRGIVKLNIKKPIILKNEELKNE